MNKFAMLPDSIRTHPQRTLLRYYGGKSRIADWIVSWFPQHKIYCESFGGGAAVLLKKEPTYAEIYNDLDEEIVNLFRVIRDPELSVDLIRAIELTPYARNEFNGAYIASDDPVERARRTIIKSFMGYSSDSITRPYKNSFKASDLKRYQFSSVDWSKYPHVLAMGIKRFKTVQIENLPAVDCIRKYDTPGTLHYLDPPYRHDSRNDSYNYRYEMTDEDHLELLEIITTELSGMVIISSYENDLYHDMLKDFKMEKRRARVQAGNKEGSKYSYECIWISPNVPLQQTNLFKTNTNTYR